MSWLSPELIEILLTILKAVVILLVVVTCGAFMSFAPGAGPQSLFVAAGIYATPAARRNWENIRKDPRSVVTFDLYEAGLVFFDGKLNKQNHIVSF